MTRRVTTSSLRCALLAAVFRSFAPAASVAAPVVELPPMMVEESSASVPWLYVNAGGTEFLSRCSSATTSDLVEAWLSKLQLVRSLVPEEFLGRMDVPAVFVLYGQDLRQKVSAEIERELQGAPARKGDGPRGSGVNIAPSMRLADRDMHASIAYIDETLFDGANLSISPSHVRFLLNRRIDTQPYPVSQLDLDRSTARHLCRDRDRRKAHRCAQYSHRFLAAPVVDDAPTHAVLPGHLRHRSARRRGSP